VIDRSRVRFPASALPGSLGQLSLPSLRVSKSSTSLLAGVKAGCVHLCQVAGNTVIPYGKLRSEMDSSHEELYAPLILNII